MVLCMMFIACSSDLVKEDVVKPTSDWKYKGDSVYGTVVICFNTETGSTWVATAAGIDSIAIDLEHLENGKCPEILE